MKAVVAAFNWEKALVGAPSVITTLRMELFEALLTISPMGRMLVSSCCTCSTRSLLSVWEMFQLMVRKVEAMEIGNRRMLRG